MIKVEYVDIPTAISTDQIKKNILDASKFNITPISSCPDWREGRPIAVLGGGPSLTNYINDLNKYNCKIACGSVHDYLVGKGVIPEYCMVIDPDPIMAKYLTKESPTAYLIASQCSPEVIKLLQSRYAEVYLCHASGTKEFNDEMFPDKQNMVPGGCTVGTRAILAAVAMGYKNIHLYGFDSCLTEDKHHAYNFVEPEVENKLLGDITEISLDHPDSPKFRVAGYMLAQIFDFQKILEVYAGTLNIEVFGGGPLAELLRLGKLKAADIQKGT